MSLGNKENRYGGEEIEATSQGQHIDLSHLSCAAISAIQRPIVAKDQLLYRFSFQVAAAAA